MATRASTSLRLHPKEKKLIEEAAQVIGNDTRSFIRNAALKEAQNLLELLAYRKYMEDVAARAYAETGPLIPHEQVMQRMKKRTAAKKK